MFEYLKGILSELSLEVAIVEVGGIGYKLFIPLSNYAKFPPLGKEVLIYISTVIREDSHKSFGFLSRVERDLFETLGEVSGIGPKTALTLVGYMEGAQLKSAISQANVSLLSKIPGIGKKTAERLIIEMRDKIEKKKEKTPLPLEKN
ncbi:MAG: Holliday junction branch migration protein RuvA, partial [Simkania negevensis]|nr:Holliday junction branch migration protein RuvA [Simkania negevensis]